MASASDIGIWGFQPMDADQMSVLLISGKRCICRTGEDKGSMHRRTVCSMPSSRCLVAVLPDAVSDTGCGLPAFFSDCLYRFEFASGVI